MFRWLHTSLLNHEALLINWIQNKGQWTRLTDAVKPPVDRGLLAVGKPESIATHHTLLRAMSRCEARCF